jgi:RNA-directed DNA polymerase
LAKILNTKLDALTYVCKKLCAINERYCMYFRDNPYSTEALYYAHRKTKKASGWKGSTQKYSHDYLTNIQELSDDILSCIYKTDKATQFTISERGKTRLVCGNTVKDRIARHALCDNVLMPRIRKKVVLDNCASQTGKGTGFCRSRLKQHLREYYRKYGNKGYILIGDISKYYDNVVHNIAKKQLEDLLDPDDTVNRHMLDDVYKHMETDVSAMTDEEYQQALVKFDSVKFFHKYGTTEKTGKRILHKGLRTGDQIAQLNGIYYPHKIDNLIQTVHGYRWYVRFNDDFIVIWDNKDDLKKLLVEIEKELDDLGLQLNKKKTVICRIDKPFKFMQNIYWVTGTGRVVEKVNKKNIQRERTKMKKLRKLNVPYETAASQYASWIGSYHKIMSKQQIRNMDILFYSLYGKERKGTNGK